MDVTWTCAIDGCDRAFEHLDALLIHQSTEHEPIRCRICEEPIPDGYPAFRHVFTEHSRAAYVRAYDASAEEVRIREAVAGYIDTTIDFDRIAEQLADGS